MLFPSEEGFAVSCPKLPGCWSEGATEAEALENIRIAIQEYLAVQRPELEAEHLDNLYVQVFVDNADPTNENVAIVRRVLETLPARDANLLRALFVEERDPAEISRSYGVDREYFRILLHKAKQRFRELYRAEETEIESRIRQATDGEVREVEVVV